MDRSRSHSRHGCLSQFRIGLQLKSVLILAAIIVGVTATGGWLYFDSVRKSLLDNDVRMAATSAQALSLAAQQVIQNGRSTALEQLAGECIRNSNIIYVSLVDSEGRALASTCREARLEYWEQVTAGPADLSRIWQFNESTILCVSPIIQKKAGQSSFVGALRLAMDTSPTRKNLLAVQERITRIAGLIVLLALPAGYFMVWRVILQPVRRLAQLSRKLAQGDMTCRSEILRKDEIGELSAAFDAMIEEIVRSRDALVMANDRLEKKVAQRTSDLERLNTRLRQEIAEREDFIRAVSHDLNAPLRNISGMATMIMMKYRGVLPEEVVSRMERIEANAQAETSLIADLLELTRIKTRPEKRQVVDMGQLVQQVADSLEFDLKGRNIELAIQAAMPSLYVEKNRVRQVFQNLLDNAIKYMNRRRGGKIEIGYRLVDDSHEFTVKDNGPGIPPNEHEKIFFVFRRAQDPAVAKTEGKGVGLAVVKSIVSNYDGRTWVQSDVGQGATFFVTLGVNCTRPPADSSEAVEEERSPAGAETMQEQVVHLEHGV